MGKMVVDCYAELETHTNTKIHRCVVDIVSFGPDQVCRVSEGPIPGYTNIRRKFPRDFIPQANTNTYIVEAGTNVEFRIILERGTGFKASLSNQLLGKQQIVGALKASGYIALFADEECGFNFKLIGCQPLQTHDGIGSVQIRAGPKLQIVTNTKLCIPERRDHPAIEELQFRIAFLGGRCCTSAFRFDPQLVTVAAIPALYVPVQCISTRVIIPDLELINGDGAKFFFIHHLSTSMLHGSEYSEETKTQGRNRKFALATHFRIYHFGLPHSSSGNRYNAEHSHLHVIEKMAMEGPIPGRIRGDPD